MSDKPSPFETLAADVLARRQRLRDDELRLNAARQKVAQTWQHQISLALHKITQQMANVQVGFGEVELDIAKDTLLGLRYPVYGLPRNAKLIIRVVSPYIAEVSLNSGETKKVFGLPDEFPESEFLDAVHVVLRAALLGPPTQSDSAH